MRFVGAIWFALAAALSACGNSDDRTNNPTDVEASATDNRGDLAASVRDRPPLAFHPVIESRPTQACDAPDVAAADGSTCYRLGPAALTLTRYGAVEATPTHEKDRQAAVAFDGEDDLAAFNALAVECFNGRPTCPTRMVATVFSGRVLSAPTVQEPRYEGQVVMVTGFDEDGLRRFVDGRES